MADVGISLLLSTTHDENGEEYSLPERINRFTRSTHAQLNRLILARLPLALPPHTTEPSTYALGLSYIAPIYITFETLWQTILDAPREPVGQSKSSSTACHDLGTSLVDFKSLSHPFDTEKSKVSQPVEISTQTQFILGHLQVPGLLRWRRLQADLRMISGRSEDDIEAHFRDVAKDGKLSEFLAHIRTSIVANPHVIVAYAWVLYMAMFAGGRYLRASLENAGHDFWARTAILPSCLPYQHATKESLSRSSEEELKSRRSLNDLEVSHAQSSTAESSQRLQFFHFPGAEDGEDIKNEFKKRVAEAELLLSCSQKNDIVREGQQIFAYMVQVVGELDNVMEAVTSQRYNSKYKGAYSPPSKPQSTRTSSYMDTLRNHAAFRVIKFSDAVPSVHLQSFREVAEKVASPLYRCFLPSESLKTKSSTNPSEWIYLAEGSLIAGTLILLVAFLIWCLTSV